MERTGAREGEPRGLRRALDYSATWTAASNRRPLLVAFEAVHLSKARRRAARQAHDAPDPRLAGRAARRGRLGVHDSQGLPAAPRRADHGCEEDKILPRNPCRIRGAGEERAQERPVLTVAQVFELAELVGRRPVGNVRKLDSGGYRLRFRCDGVMRTAPEVFPGRQEAERTLWRLAEDGRADCDYDRRYRAMVLLATFASLRWGEVAGAQEVRP